MDYARLVPLVELSSSAMTKHFCRTRRVSDEQTEEQIESATDPKLEEVLSPSWARSTKDQLLRTAAEFDNYRKRQKRELDELKAYASEKVLLQMIPVLDNLDRAVGAVSEDKKNPLVQGVKMVADQFRQVLEAQGVKRFESLGKAFDPARHEGDSSSAETPDAAPGTVLEEFQSELFARRPGDSPGNGRCCARAGGRRAELTPIFAKPLAPGKMGSWVASSA